MQQNVYRLLLIEDNPGDADLIAMDLAEIPGYEFKIFQASSLQSAQEMLGQTDLDAVVLDLSLPDSYGMETLRRLRAMRSDIDCIVLSGSCSEALSQQALAEGACDFISKSDISSKMLINSLLYVLERQRAIRGQEQLLKLLAANPDAVLVVDLDGVVRFVNEATLNLFGRSREDFVGELIGFSAKEGEISEIEVRHGDKLRIAEMHVVSLEWEGQPACLASLRDITEQKKLANQLQQSSKMEALGRLAGGITHDFNNILTSILGNVRLAQIDSPRNHHVQESLGEIERAVERASELLREILLFSRQKELKREPTHLAPLVQEVVRFVRPTLPPNVHIITNFASQLPATLADPIQLHRVLMNLVTNAVHAMRDNGGRLEVTVGDMNIDSNTAYHFSNIKPGNYVTLEVCDTGHGMDKQTLQHIFDPFFTTKPMGEGTGLGLSVVHGIVRDHGGTISVHSEPGKGTQFRLYFPAASFTAQRIPSQASQSTNGQGKHILYIDDEQALVMLGRRMLTRLGYVVTGYTDPAAALQAFELNPEQFDAVITDLSMPGMSGFALGRALRAVRADVPIIMTSGYVRPEDEANARQLDLYGILLKPNTLEDLGRLLSEVFRSSSVDHHQDSLQMSQSINSSAQGVTQVNYGKGK